MKRSFRLSLCSLFTALIFLSLPVAGSAGIQGPGSSQTTATASRKAAPNTAPTAQEIADAKSKGLVWVNTSTRVYHSPSSSIYGTTKHGKFMTEDDAKKAGYRAAKETTASKKKQ